jgi:hypothetical protein
LILITGCIEAREKIDMITTNSPNFFVHTSAGLIKEGERMIMKIRCA